MGGLLIVIISSLFFTPYVSSMELYENDGRITVLTADNFTDFVQSQPTLVLFYLHTCGFCQDYAPKLKNLSKSVESWRWAVKIAVINCAFDRNISNHFDIDTFPTFLFFSRGIKPFPVNKYYSENTFREKLSDLLVNRRIHDRLVPKVDISNSIAVFGPDINQVAMIILDTQLNIPARLQSFIVKGDQYGVKDISGKTVFSSEDVEAVRDFLIKNYQSLEKEPLQPINEPVYNDSRPSVNPAAYSMPVYAADVITSLQNLLTHDIALKQDIRGVSLEALKEFLTVLSKYLDLGLQYNKEIAFLQENLANKTAISREEWLGLLAQMKLSTDKVQYIACRGSKVYLRGYPCGLWIMFHSMTVNRLLKDEKSDEKAPIAHALNRFVPRFFSCSNCAFHFAKMTSNVRLPGEAIYPELPDQDPPFPLMEPDPSTLPIPPKSARDEVLWLNIAHNMVNERLSGNPSEDPAAPKSVFPSPQQCRACWSEETRTKVVENKFAARPDVTDELLAYLVHHYRPSSWRWDEVCVSFEDISQLGLGKNVFSTTDFVLVGLICVCCAAALTALFALICCRLRCSRRDHVPLPVA